jgi:hypothetical protein
MTVIDCSNSLDEVQKMASSMIDCYEVNLIQQKRQNPMYKDPPLKNGKKLIDDKQCYDKYSVARGNVKCSNLNTVLESVGYTLTDEFIKDTTVNPKIRALKSVESRNDWFVGVL